MRLAFIIFRYFPFGGLQRDFLRIAHACHEKGHSVDAYIMEKEGKLPNWLHLEHLPVKGFTNHEKARKFAHLALDKIKKSDHDLIIGFNRMPGLDLYFAGDVCFKCKYEKKIFTKITRRYRIFQQLEQAVFAPESKTHIITLTALELKKYQATYNTPKKRLHLLPPEITEEMQRPNNAEKIRGSIRKKHSLQEKDFLLLIVASSFKTKGLDRALKAIASLPNKYSYKLLIIGGDKKVNKYQNLAKKLGILNRVYFLGSQNSILEFLLAADLLVHPARFESAGITLLEALCAGLPILATNICGYSTHIKKAKGGILLSSPFSQQQMNTALKNMLDQSKLKTWQTNELAYIKQMELHGLTRNAVELIETL